MAALLLRYKEDRFPGEVVHKRQVLAAGYSKRKPLVVAAGVDLTLIRKLSSRTAAAKGNDKEF